MLFPSLIAALIARLRAHRAEKRRREIESRHDHERRGTFSKL